VADVALISTVFDGRPTIVFMVHDVTETQALRAQVMQADRLASMGTLAAGVAHEINNPLTWVLSSLAQAQEDLAELTTSSPPLAKVSALVADAQDGAERVVKIARELSAFTRSAEPGPPRAELRAVLARAATMAAHEIRHRAELVEDFEEVPAAAADPLQLGQVFLNLLINAAHAIRAGAASDNRITLRTRRRGADRIAVEIEDTGEGIAKERLGRLFDAYYTTKPVGVGTGLGLFICKRIVESAGGNVEVESTLGKGSIFRVILPLAGASKTVRPSPPANAKRAAGAGPARRLKILVCDDEPAVARALSRLLRGHDVSLASSGREALDVLQGEGAFDLAFCDVMMPEMTGIDLYERLAADASFDVARIVFMTGGTFTPGAAQFLQTIPNRVLDKPFDTALVARIVAEVERVGVPSSKSIPAASNLE
jgi:nitrogen-specific signal transduction histidine kinase